MRAGKGSCNPFEHDGNIGSAGWELQHRHATLRLLLAELEREERQREPNEVKPHFRDNENRLQLL